MKASRFAVVVLAVACGMRCSAPLPTGPEPIAPQAAAPISSPSQAGSVTSQGGPPNAVFSIKPDPAEGLAPLEVTINMCKSTDPDPGDELKFTVEWGDETKDLGHCRLSHTYAKPGDYTAVACVSDRSNAPVCKQFPVRATNAETSPKPTAKSIVLSVRNTSCWNSPGSFELVLNGVALGSFQPDPTGSCTCSAPLQTFTVSSSSVAAAWVPEGSNALVFRRVGATYPGNALAWASASVGREGKSNLNACLFDAGSSGCTASNICSSGYTWNDVSSSTTLVDN